MPKCCFISRHLRIIKPIAVVHRVPASTAAFAFLALSGVIFRPAVCATSAPCGLVASVLRTDVPRRHASLGPAFGSPCGKSKMLWLWLLLSIL